MWDKMIEQLPGFLAGVGVTAAVGGAIYYFTRDDEPKSTGESADALEARIRAQMQAEFAAKKEQEIAAQASAAFAAVQSAKVQPAQQAQAAAPQAQPANQTPSKGDAVNA